VDGGEVGGVGLLDVADKVLQFFVVQEIAEKWVRFAGGGGVALLPWRAVPQRAVGYRVVERLVDISLHLVVRHGIMGNWVRFAGEAGRDIGEGEVGLVARGVLLEVFEEFEGLGELAVEMGFVTDDAVKKSRIGEHLGANTAETKLVAEVGFIGVFGFRFLLRARRIPGAEVVTLVIFAAVEFFFADFVDAGEEVLGGHFLGFFHLLSNMGGFGGDGSLGAPEAVDDAADEDFLEDALRAEVVEDRFGEHDVFARVFFDGVGVEDDVSGIEAMFDGVAAGDGFAVGSFGSG